ncbi:LuxR C-terminal-related transcriptional regulator [Leucobacter sp. UT-8R-CII-1-4]|uniref:helix-turn-helix transcriptional regulator n=1 Tax=Leucobacter sp. UT-8R-CII-1-4 TaxID=3040075 RepID=UPI0024A9FC91|nr:LuxR family transcriptional regulator [Leucobacter sp. UT-8R-CII-1-4]MDI6022187.1 LuxR C-terminal-related transcriptional regulator [Leucobacter sp. UT-8R-CII-1-4]
MIDPTEVPSLLITRLLFQSTPMIWVLDDLHLTSQEFQTQLLSVFQGCPSLQLIVTTRNSTVFEQALPVGGIGMTLIGSDELAFTMDEMLTLLGYGRNAESIELADRLHRATNGHVLASRLAVAKFRDAGPAAAYRMLDGRVQEHTRALATQYLPEFVTEQERQFACAVALCPELSIELAEALLPKKFDSWALVRDFESRGFGRITVRGSVELFQLHALIRAALVSEAPKVLGSRDMQYVRAKAFELLEGTADPVALFRVALDGDLDDKVFAFFARNFSELSLVRTRECLTAVEQISNERLYRGWQLALVYAVLLVEDIAKPSARSRSLARHAMKNLDRAAQPPQGAESLMLSLARFTVSRVVRDWEQAGPNVDQFLEDLRAFQATQQEGDPTLWFAVLLQTMLTKLLCGDLPGVLAIAPQLATDSHPARRLHTHGQLSFVHAYRGDILIASRHLREISSSFTPAGWESSIRSVGWQLGGALVLANAGQPGEAHRQLEMNLPELARVEYWPAVLWTKARLRFLAGDAAAGLAELTAESRSLVDYPISPWWRERLRVVRAELFLAVGDLASARFETQQLSKSADVQLIDASVSLASGDLEHAFQLVTSVRTNRDATTAEAVQALLLRSVIKAHLGHENTARQRANEAMHAIGRSGNRMPLSMLPFSELQRLRAMLPATAWIEPVSSPLKFDVSPVSLTVRERDVLKQLASPRGLDAIAAELYVSSNTLKTHLRSIYRKLGAADRHEAVRLATERGVY